MALFEIVAHRGVSIEAPENTIPAFQRAMELGADAVELDVRLTADGVPVVYHYFYLDEITALSGPIFEYTWKQLQGQRHFNSGHFSIPTLHEVLETLGGKIGLEIEIKGPEPESSEKVAAVLHQFKQFWETIEVTSYEPTLLFDIHRRCPNLATDLLFPRSEEWMKLDVVTYLAIHRAKLAQARAVHLHPTQLSPEVVTSIRQQGIEVHSWEINDERTLNFIWELKIPKICTDKLPEALAFRQRISCLFANQEPCDPDNVTVYLSYLQAFRKPIMLIRDNSFEVRTITPDDLCAVLEVYRQCEDFLALGAVPTASREMVLKDIENSQREGGVFCGIYTASGEMIGVVDFVPSNFSEDPHAAFLSLLIIAAPFRKRGIGTTIVELIENEIRKDTQVTTILTAVQVNNPEALRFWQKNGYHIVGKPELQPDQTTTWRLQKNCNLRV